MGYAVFEGDARLSRAFETEEDAQSKAENAGLLTRAPDGTVILEDDLSIRPCSDAAAGSSASDDLEVQIEAPDAFDGASGVLQNPQRAGRNEDGL